MFAEDEQPLHVRFDALLETTHLAHRVRSRAQRVTALSPEELDLVVVLLGDGGNEGQHGLPVRRRQLIETAPPLMRLSRCACETRSLPLMRILPSSRMVMFLRLREG